MYDLTLADLSFPNTKLSVSLKLADCPHIIVATAMEKPLGFAAYVGMGKAVGAGYLEFTKRHAPSPLSEKITLADARRHTLAKSDPMHRVATNYHSHQLMREFVRRTLMQAGTVSEIQFLMAALSVWLLMHDPIRANFTRQRTRNTFRDHQCAMFTIACSADRAYVSHVGDRHIDLTEALRIAQHSTEPGIILEPRNKTPTSSSVH